MTNAIDNAVAYLNADMDSHIEAHGKWRLDRGKLMTAIGGLAAAPDLLSALRGFLHADADVFRDELAAAHAAIAKAEVR